MSKLARYDLLVLFVSCSLYLLGTGIACAQSTTASKEKTDAAPFAGEIAAFEKWDRQNSAPVNAVLFVGSSSIRLWQTAESFPGLPVINRGFGGSQISNVNHYAQQIVVKYKPRLIVFYAGDNDIASGKSSQQVADDFATFVDLVRADLPEVTIIYLPIKPSLARWKMWPQMQKANQLIADRWQRDKHFEYVDTATPMLGDDGQPRSELFLDDGLHMNPAGYEVWNEELRPVLQNRLKSAASGN